MKHFISSLSVINANTPPCEGRVSSRKILSLLLILFLGIGNVWAEEVTYVFTSKDWAAKIGSTAANWTSNKAGAGFSNNGIQVTTAATGANGTSPISYNNISQIVVTYNTNTSKGKGTLSIKIGDNAVTTNNWQYSGSANGTSANFTSIFDYSSPQSGKVTLTANTTTNSIYVVSIKIITSAGGGETPDPTPDPGTGTTGTLVITRASFPSGSLAYNTTDNWSATASTGETVSGQGDLYSTSNQTTMQTKNSSVSTHYHNTTAMPGAISRISVDVASGTDRSYTVYASTTAITSTTGLTSLGSLKGATPIEIDPTKDYKYFWLQCTGGASYLNNITITYNIESSGGGEPETPKTDLTDAQFAWSAQTAEATMGASNTFPTLTNTLPVSVTYESSTPATATIAADGTITLVAPGTTTISAKFAGGEVSGTTYAAKTVKYDLTVLKAPATPTENVYVKVTETAGITDGEYLIVYEDAEGNPKAPVAFDGSLAPVKLDVASNNIEVSIASNTIAGNTDIDAATFTINTTAGTIQTKDGYYIGQTSNANGLATSTTTEYTNTISIENDGSATIISSGGAYLRYNSANDNLRFRYFKSSTYTAQKAIALYKKASKHTVTIADCTNGSVSASVANGAQVLSGTTVTLENTPATGYKLTAYDVYKTGETTKVTVDGNTFVMPEFDVTISATFELAKTLTEIKITTPATQTTFWQGETFNSTGLKVTAHFDGAANEDVTDKVTVTGSTATAGTQTVTISYKEGATTETATYNITVKATANTQETAYNVATAREIIDAVSTAKDIYVTGVVSEIVTAYNSQYGNISYNISADGLTTSDQLLSYRGKSYNGENFTSDDDIQVGDEVVVKGNLKLYEDTYEFDAGNQLVSLNRTKQQAGLSYTTSEYNLNLGDAFTAPTLNNPHTLAVTYSSNNEDVATVAADGAVTIKAAGTVTITASFAGNASYAPGEASYTIKVVGIASLPFAFDGKCADIANTAGMSQEGIDLDDYASSPHLKINTTGDYLTIHFDSEPDKLTYDIKGNSFSGGTFTVQESADGETYTTIATYTELGEKVSEEKELESTSRYVKFIYTKKVNGNVALGNISITKPDTRKDAGLAWSEETVTLTVGDAFTAPTFSNPNEVEVTYTSDNESLATISDAGVIALVENATGTATITATFAGDATYKPATATCVVIVNEYVEIVSGVWQLVKDAADLKAGNKVIVASAEAVDGKYYALSTTQNKNNRGQADVNKIEENVTFSTDVQVLTLEVGVEENTFAFNTGSGYLYAASSSANHLKTQEDLDANGSWTISIDANTGVATVKAQGGNTHNLMQYNKSSKLFSSYDNPQQGIALYKKMPDYTREVRQGYYGTICLPTAGQMVGASIFEIAYKDASKIYFDEIVSGEMEAGIPYIFLPNEGVTTLKVFYTEMAVVAAGSRNGLVGSYTQELLAVDGNNYILLNNQYCEVIGEAYVGENRAYFQLGSIPDSAPAPAHGVRRVSMGMAGQNTATGVDQVEGNNVPTKMIINGQLYILRGEKMYDAQGKLVK